MYHCAVVVNGTSIGSNKGQNLPKSLNNKKIRRNRRTSSKSPIKATSSKSRKNSLGSTSMYFFVKKSCLMLKMAKFISFPKKGLL